MMDSNIRSQITLEHEVKSKVCVSAVSSTLIVLSLYNFPQEPPTLRQRILPSHQQIKRRVSPRVPQRNIRAPLLHRVFQRNKSSPLFHSLSLIAFRWEAVAGACSSRRPRSESSVMTLAPSRLCDSSTATNTVSRRHWGRLRTCAPLAGQASHSYTRPRRTALPPYVR